jgi:hypothetical protein
MVPGGSGKGIMKRVVKLRASADRENVILVIPDG